MSLANCEYQSKVGTCLWLFAIEFASALVLKRTREIAVATATQHHALHVTCFGHILCNASRRTTIQSPKRYEEILCASEQGVT